jgi:hypothetical protein
MEWFVLTCETLACVVCGEPITPPGSAVHNVGYGLRADLWTTDAEVVAFARTFEMESLTDFIAWGNHRQRHQLFRAKHTGDHTQGFSDRREIAVAVAVNVDAFFQCRSPSSV